MTVIVGEDVCTFSIHQELLCGDSGFFTSAMKKD